LVDISVIIVNYNVQALLEQTVLSVYKAASNLNIEIIVVDNHSADESCNMIRRRFKEVILIDNQENVGFSRANNQGIEIAKGQHVLILNPDTVLSEDSLSKTHQYLLTHIDVGALGVRMIDGRGTFLPESKRGLPTPMVAFYKMSGLAKLFPNSKRFGAYHLSYLNEFENHEVDVLSGAFMMIKKKVLDEVGYFDESFFMYGEDIDLSYRIQKAGYKNVYFAETTIIHYKGESTKKHSVNYVKIFYQAMAKFAKKHFSKQQGWWFSVCINLAIFLRAIIALINRTFSQLKLVAADYILTYLAYVGITRYWEHYNKFVDWRILSRPLFVFTCPYLLSFLDRRHLC
jgi:O-antigen biosynthesis protein